MKLYTGAMQTHLETSSNENVLEKIDDTEYGDNKCLFALFKDSEFEDFEMAQLDLPRDEDWKNCPDCDIKMQPMECSYQCMQCGRELKVIEQNGEYSTSIIDNYKTNNKGTVSIRIVGNDSHRYNRALLKTTSDYSKMQSNNTDKQLNRCNSHSRDGKLPIIILNDAVDLYSKVQTQGIVRRGNGRLGTLGACLSYICDKHGVTKKPKEIAAFLNIEESYLSKGDKLLRRLHSEGKIDIPIHHNPKDAYILQYFQSLSIDNKYKPFISELIDVASKVDEMIGENNSRMSTKCAGAIYTLKTQESLEFSKSDIVKYCKISKSTFIRYYEFLLSNRKSLKEVFKKYNIPPLKRIKKMKKNAKSLLNMRVSVMNSVEK